MTIHYIQPSARDWEECRLAIETFPYGSGSFDHSGNLCLNAAAPFQLRITFPTSIDVAKRLWLDHVPKTSPGYELLAAADRPFIELQYWKLGVGLLRQRWVGEVRLFFEVKGEINLALLGSVVGDTQASMIDHLRRVIASKAPMFISSEQALTERQRETAPSYFLENFKPIMFGGLMLFWILFFVVYAIGGVQGWWRSF